MYMYYTLYIIYHTHTNKLNTYTFTQAYMQITHTCIYTCTVELQSYEPFGKWLIHNSETLKQLHHYDIMDVKPLLTLQSTQYNYTCTVCVLVFSSQLQLLFQESLHLHKQLAYA